jgi:hypothetical protein
VAAPARGGPPRQPDHRHRPQPTLHPRITRILGFYLF